MNNAWAVVVGAFIALIGSVAAPWVKDNIERRAGERAELRTLQRDAILNLVVQCGAVLKASSQGAEVIGIYQQAAAASAQFGMLLSSADSDLDFVVANTVNHMTEIRGDVRLGSMQTRLQEWYRGEITARQALERYKGDIIESIVTTET